MRFKLTTGFVVVSIAIFAISAIVITRSAERNEASNLIDVVSQQSSRDAMVIAGVLTDAVGSPEPTFGSGAASDSPTNYASAAMTAFLSNSDITRLSLIDVDGSLIWSTAGDAQVRVSATNEAFARAAGGEASTDLIRGVPTGAYEGGVESYDMISTFIPLLDVSTKRPSQIIEVTRDVTDVLDARITSTRNSNFRTVFSTLGGAFFVLFGIVLSADIVLGRSHKRSIRHEHALSEEKMVARSLATENKQLKEMNEERDRFLSMVSHELRTPLTAMIGFTDIIRMRLDDEALDKNVKHLDAMRRNGDHLNTLIGDMLEVTRIQSGNFDVTKEGFVLERLLQQVEESGRVLLRARGQTLNIERSEHDLELNGDQTRVMQVLLNLLSNASKYSPENGTITLGIEQVDESVKLSVRDEGAGIPEDECKRLFERFYRRDDEATRSQSGLGLGLSIVKAIVDAHHGHVEVASTVGVGTTMTVTLPGSRKVVPQESMAVAPVPTSWKRMSDLRSIPKGAQPAA